MHGMSKCYIDKETTSIIGCYLYADMSISRTRYNDRQAIGLIFDIDPNDGGVWVMALSDTACTEAHTPDELPHTDALFDDFPYNRLTWTVAESRHWEALLVNVCGCGLSAIDDGFEEHRRGYSFDADKANTTLAAIGINVGADGYVYWTATTESNGDAEMVGYGEITEEPMPYTDAEAVCCRLRFVGHITLDDMREEYSTFTSFDTTVTAHGRRSCAHPVYFYGRGQRNDERVVEARPRFHNTDDYAYEIPFVYDCINRFNQLRFGVKAFFLNEATYVSVTCVRGEDETADEAKAKAELVADEAATMLDRMLRGEDVSQATWESDFIGLGHPTDVVCTQLMKVADCPLSDDIAYVGCKAIDLIANRLNAISTHNRYLLRDGYVVMEGWRDWQDEGVDRWREIMFYAPLLPV